MAQAIVNFLRRQLWHRLPPSTREAILYRVAARFAPRIMPFAPGGEPIFVVGLLRSATGIGAAARSCYTALREAGFRVYGVDLTALSAREPVLVDFAFDDGRDFAGQGTVLLHVGGSLVPIAMCVLGKSFVHNKRVIAHWFWELPRAPENWRLAMPFVHDIFVNTRFVERAVRPIAERRPIHIVPYPLASVDVRKPAHQPCRPFTVLVIFSVSSNFFRKNPCAAIAAFRKAFGDDPSVRLVVKYADTFAWPKSAAMLAQAVGEAKNIELVGAVLDEGRMAALYDEADVVMSLHRSEGLGLVLAEAMQRGIPVVATDWSATQEFLDSTTGVPIRYRLVPVHDPQGNYRDRKMLWAEPSVEEAAAALKALRKDPMLRARLGASAVTRVATIFNPSNYAEYVAGLMTRGAPFPSGSAEVAR